jgi:hypothetical protein
MSGEQKTWCHCSECVHKGGLDANGKPKGCAISTRHLKVHLLRVKRAEADRMTAEHEQSARIDAAGAQIFTAALLNDGPDLESQPSKLWTSRAEFQAERASHIMPPACGDVSSTSSIEAVVDGVRRIMISSDSLPSSNAHRVQSHHVADNIVDDFNHLSLANKAPLPQEQHIHSTSPGFSQEHRSKTSKKDRSYHTTKALAILDTITTELQSCGEKLSGSPSPSDISDSRKILSRTRAAMEKITRSTSDIDKRKAELEEQMGNVEGRLVVLDALLPRDGPKDYATGG